MDRLTNQYQRLYQPPAPEGGATDAPGLMGGDGRVRAMVLALSGPADWALLSAVWRGVQADLEWPAPAIAVNGVDAFELWFSLAEPVPAAEAAAMLQGLCQRYLADVKPTRIRTWPAADASPWTAERIPAQQEASGGWSAFVAPDLPAVFGDEPVLDFQPGEDAQAELLARLSSIGPAEWRAALSSGPAAAPEAHIRPNPSPAPQAGPEPLQPLPRVDAHGAYEDPRQFLLDVMNDGGVALALRVEAAKALL